MLFTRGRITRQAHVDIPEGTVEEEYARGGFFGRYAHIYRTAPLVNWSRIEGDLRPLAFTLERLPGLGGDYTSSRTPFLRNADCVLRFATLLEAMPYYFRNGDGDEVLFVHRGRGVLETDFGPLAYRVGDYLVIPRGTMYRISPEQETRLLIIETAGEVRLPEKGILGQHALFDPAVINVPTPECPAAELGASLLAPRNGEWEVRVQRQSRLTSIFYPFDPMNVVGWKGDLTVWQLNVADIRPILSERYHLPPTAHATFVADRVVIVSFLPRGLETGDPNALRVPFYHANIDYDEVLFYHAGEFFSRAGVGPGMVTFHPQGLHHGPQPQAVAASKTKERTEEQAVMIDTQSPLEVCPEAYAAEVDDYWRSWMGGMRSRSSANAPEAPDAAVRYSQPEHEEVR
ncbi:MAG: homogentisate 1,2-dioxygenase [Candidatus Eisenbacteria bacterium]|nr:homogentisate 1,2-dioxygenase [Candidatus Eisenbacteria bacterium]